MRLIQRLCIHFLLFALLSIARLALHDDRALAQASLAAEDISDEVSVTNDQGTKLTFTLVRDARRRDQWYYIPNQPRLFEDSIDGKREPEFSLIEYQARDPNDSQKLVAGGILTFAVTFAAPDVQESLKKYLANKYPEEATAIRLSALPLKSAEVHVYQPNAGVLLQSAFLGEGIAPVFASQKMVFQVPLTTLGSDVYSGLVNSHGGVPVFMTFTYEGLTPASNLRVKVNLSRAYDYYSKDEKFRAAASYYGLFGASYQGDWSKISSTLYDNKIIEIEGTTSADFDYAKLDAILQPLLKRINDAILVDFAPPPRIDPAVAADPTANGYFGSVGESVAMKSVSEHDLSTETFDFNIRSLEQRKSIAGGLIGIGAYPKDVRDGLITVIPNGPWRSAYFLAPAVGDDPTLGINQVDLQVNLIVDNAQLDAQTIQWKPTTGWTDRDGKVRNTIAFPLTADASSSKPISFEQIAQITRGNSVTIVHNTLPVAFGERPLVAPVSLVDVIQINADDLTFRRLDQRSELLDASVSLTLPSGDILTGSLRPYRLNNQWITPSPLIWLMQHSNHLPAPILARVVFHLENGSDVIWKESGRDLRIDFPALDVSLRDSDWKSK